MNSAITIVFLHGLGGSTDDFYELPEILKKQYEIINIAIPGHESPESLRDSDFNEVCSIVQAQIPLNREIFLVGHSLGSIFCLTLAKIIKPVGMILMSTPCHFAWYERIVINILSHFPYKLPSGGTVERYINNFLRRDVFFEENKSHEYYYGKTLKKYMDFVINNTKNLSYIHCPVLLFCGKHDNVVNPKNSLRIFHLLPHTIKKEVINIDTDHMMLSGPSSGNTIVNILSFLQHLNQ